MSEHDIHVIDKLLFLLNENHRYKVAYGGRGSGKSVGFADACLIKALKSKIRILCTRQLQTSIKDSVHKLLCDRIEALGLLDKFEVTRETIRCETGSEFIFKGIQNNVMEIKSMEGIDIAWCEEAQSISKDSWDVLIPTIRKEGSEIWVTFNPDHEEDETYQRFVKHPPPDCKSVLVNYTDNPYFPEVLRREMEYCKSVDYPRYEHIWLGKTIVETEAQIFKGKFEVLDFEAEPYTEFFYGADWGFACLGGDTMVATNNGDVPIKDIKVGDMVLTRDGYKKVLGTKNKGKKQVYGVDFGYKNSIIATADHRIFTENGWKRVDKLRGKETICLRKLSLMEKLTKGTPKGNTQTIFIGKGEGKTKNIVSYTGIFGSFIMGLFQKIMIFITLMGTHLIIPLKTLCVSAKANIKKFITKINLGPYQKRGWMILGQKTDIQKKIGLKEDGRLWKLFRKGVSGVKSVAKNLYLQMFTKSFVVQGVGNTQIRVIAKKNTFVRRVVKNLWHRLMTKEKLVQKSVPINLQLLKEKQDVYDITVENGEFFANGVLVHNCDPTALTRCFIENNCLYIDYEAGGVGVEMEEIPALFDSVPESRKWRIRADAARPETISYVARHGFDCVAAEKWKGSVEDGIEYMRSFEKIYIHPRCKRTLEEFKYYSYKKDRISGDVLPIVVDAWNHCFVKGTLVTTKDGLKPIEKITTNDFVLTRKGYKKVKWAGVSDWGRVVYKVKTKNGLEIIGTPEHKVLTSNGFCDIISLRYGDKLLTKDNKWLKQQKCLDLYGTDILNLKEGQIGNILEEEQRSFTDLYGKSIRASAGRAMSFTTLTGILKTTIYPIWKKLAQRNTVSIILSLMKCGKKQENGLNNTITSGDGIVQKMALNGTKNTQRNKTGGSLICPKRFVNIVKKNLSQKHIMTDSVPTNAKVRGEEEADLMTLLKIVNGVEKSLEVTSMQKLGFAVDTVQAVEVVGLADKVYDIMVEEQNEFFANGVLVHNCIDSIRYALQPYIKNRGKMVINQDWEVNVESMNDDF